MTYEERKAQLLKDPEVRKEYDALELEFEIIRAINIARIKLGMTQEELSKKTGIPQANISRLEKGKRKPTFETLQKLANGLDMHIEIKLVPNK